MEIPIDKNVTPIAQAVRKISFSRRAALKVVSKLLDEDISEQVESPTPWVSPTHLVLKKNGEFRLCVDLRRANKAVKRKRILLPNIEESLEGFEGSGFFSKLDIRWGFYQIELKEKSRPIITFSTPFGLFRFKKLMFGLSYAPEAFHEIIAQIL